MAKARFGSCKRKTPKGKTKKHIKGNLCLFKSKK